MPSANTTHAETTVLVTDFGADPTGVRDSTAAVNAAIVHACTFAGPVRVLFPPGTYQLYPDEATVRELYVSNTVGADPAHRLKRIAMLVEGAHDLTIDGGGSRVVLHGEQTIFAALRSSRVTLTGFDLDWRTPRVVDLAVVASEGSTRDLRIPEGYGYDVVEGRRLRVASEDSPVTGRPYWVYDDLADGLYAQVLDTATGRSHRSGDTRALFDGVTDIKEVAPGILRVTWAGEARALPRVGTVLQIRTTTRDHPGMLAFQSSDVTISDMRVGFLHGFGILDQMGDGFTVRGVDFRAPADGGRHTAAFADLVHVSGDRGHVLIEDNTFGFAHDDAVNVHGTYVQFVSGCGTEATFEFRHPETAGFPVFHAGDEVCFVDRTTMLDVPGWVGVVVEVDGPTGFDHRHDLTRMTLTFDRPIPDVVDGGRYVAENLTYGPGLTVRGNRFAAIPTRGVLATTRRPVLIEGNVFDGVEMASILISADANAWYESGAVRDVTIRRNTFLRPHPDTQDQPVILIAPEAERPGQGKVHRNIRIEDNTFDVGDSTVLEATSVDGLTFTGNLILRPDDAARPEVVLHDVTNFDR